MIVIIVDIMLETDLILIKVLTIEAEIIIPLEIVKILEPLLLLQEVEIQDNNLQRLIETEVQQKRMLLETKR